jgi:uncharacterized membrane protein
MIKNYLNSISSKKRGIIFLLMSSFSFAVMALFVNLAGDMPVFMKAFFRNIVACLLTIPMLARSSGGFKIQKGNLPYLIGRATLGTVGIFCNFYAISQINIADALILNKLSPFFAIIASVFILGEVANGWQWLAVVVALAGSIFVVKPTFIFGLADSGFDSARFFPAMIGLIGGSRGGRSLYIPAQAQPSGRKKHGNSRLLLSLLMHRLHTVHNIDIPTGNTCSDSVLLLCRNCRLLRSVYNHRRLWRMPGKRDISLRLLNGNLRRHSRNGISRRIPGLTQHNRVYRDNRRLRLRFPLQQRIHTPQKKHKKTRFSINIMSLPDRVSVRFTLLTYRSISVSSAVGSVS